ncbi:hypothetical protein D3C77_522870 [compost metagenome]
MLHQRVQLLVQLTVEAVVADDQVGFQIERQAQRIEVARTHRRPLVVGQRDLAVQRAAAVFVDLHAVAHQVVVEHARTELGDRHVRLALEDQSHPDTASRGVADLAQHAIAREEISVGDQ